ncbi:MAG: WhiB family transcriptional regulator [Acidimicrobiia bacterium]
MSVQASENLWQVRAACRGPQKVVFYPPSQFERKRDKLERERRAKKICSECSVRQACLDYALAIRDPHGIWGGLSENERQLLYSQAS